MTGSATAGAGARSVSERASVPTVETSVARMLMEGSTTEPARRDGGHRRHGPMDRGRSEGLYFHDLPRQPAARQRRPHPPAPVVRRGARRRAGPRRVPPVRPRRRAHRRPRRRRPAGRRARPVRPQLPRARHQARRRAPRRARRDVGGRRRVPRRRAVVRHRGGSRRQLRPADRDHAGVLAAEAAPFRGGGRSARLRHRRGAPAGPGPRPGPHLVRREARPRAGRGARWRSALPLSAAPSS